MKCLIGHFAVVFGCICGLLKLPLIKTQQLFLFSTLRTVIASAVRLGNLGPLEVRTRLYPCFLQMESHELGEKVAACSNTHRITLTCP